MRRLEDLRLRLRDFNLLQETNFEKEDHKRLRLLMTKLDKMVTKRNTAKYIQSTYNKTLNKLNRDALTMHQHLDQFEVEVVNNQVRDRRTTRSSNSQVFLSRGQLFYLVR